MISRSWRRKFHRFTTWVAIAAMLWTSVPVAVAQEVFTLEAIRNAAGTDPNFDWANGANWTVGVPGEFPGQDDVDDDATINFGVAAPGDAGPISVTLQNLPTGGLSLDTLAVNLTDTTPIGLGVLDLAGKTLDASTLEITYGTAGASSFSLADGTGTFNALIDDVVINANNLGVGTGADATFDAGGDLAVENFTLNFTHNQAVDFSTANRVITVLDTLAITENTAATSAGNVINSTFETNRVTYNTGNTEIDFLGGTAIRSLNGGTDVINFELGLTTGATAGSTLDLNGPLIAGGLNFIGDHVLHIRDWQISDSGTVTLGANAAGPAATLDGSIQITAADGTMHTIGSLVFNDSDPILSLVNASGLNASSLYVFEVAGATEVNSSQMRLLPRTNTAFVFQDTVNFNTDGNKTIRSDGGISDGNGEVFFSTGAPGVVMHGDASNNRLTLLGNMVVHSGTDWVHTGDTYFNGGSSLVVNVNTPTQFSSDGLGGASGNVVVQAGTMVNFLYDVGSEGLPGVDFSFSTAEPGGAILRFDAGQSDFSVLPAIGAFDGLAGDLTGAVFTGPNQNISLDHAAAIPTVTYTAGIPDNIELYRNIGGSVLRDDITGITFDRATFGLQPGDAPAFWLGVSDQANGSNHTTLPAADVNNIFAGVAITAGREVLDFDADLTSAPGEDLNFMVGGQVRFQDGASNRGSTWFTGTGTVNIFGSGELELETVDANRSPLKNSPTVTTINRWGYAGENGDGRNSVVFRVDNAGALPDGVTLNVYDGRFIHGDATNLAASAVVNINQGATWDLTTTILNNGTVNINEGGAIYTSSVTIHGSPGSLDLNFNDPDSLLILDANLAGDNRGNMLMELLVNNHIVLNASDIDDHTWRPGNTGPSRGIVLGQDNYLLTPVGNTVDVATGSVQAAKAGDGSVLVDANRVGLAAFSARTLDINASIDLAGIDVLIGNTVAMESIQASDFRDRESHLPTGIVAADGQAQMGNVTILSGRLEVGDAVGDSFVAESITNNSTTVNTGTNNQTTIIFQFGDWRVTGDLTHNGVNGSRTELERIDFAAGHELNTIIGGSLIVNGGDVFLDAHIGEALEGAEGAGDGSRSDLMQALLDGRIAAGGIIINDGGQLQFEPSTLQADGSDNPLGAPAITILQDILITGNSANSQDGAQLNIDIVNSIDINNDGTSDNSEVDGFGLLLRRVEYGNGTQGGIRLADGAVFGVNNIEGYQSAHLILEDEATAAVAALGVADDFAIMGVTALDPGGDGNHATLVIDPSFQAVIYGTIGPDIDLDVGGTLTFFDASIVVPEDLTIRSGGLVRLGAAEGLANLGAAGNVLDLNGGTLLYTGADADLTSAIRDVRTTAAGSTISVAAAATTLTISDVIDGAGGLTKSGDGTLVLSAANTYSGATTVSGGTLRLGHADALQNTSLLAITGSTIDLNGMAQQLPTVVLTHGTIDSSGGATTIEATSGGFDFRDGEVTSQVSLAGTSPGADLTKSGGGTVTIHSTRDAAYNGNTFVLDGTLVLANTNAIGSGNLAVSGGTLDIGAFNQSVAAFTQSGGLVTNRGLGGEINFSGAASFTGGTFDALLTGSGDVDFNSPRPVHVLGELQHTGATTISGGEVYAGQFATLAANVPGTITVGAGSALVLTGTNNLGSNRTLHVNTTAGVLTVLGLGGDFIDADFTFFGDGNPVFDATGSGVLALHGATRTFDLSPSLVGNGLWYLGATRAGGTLDLAGSQLTPAADNVYRLGGGLDSGIDLNGFRAGALTIAGTGTLGGTNDVVIGSTEVNGQGDVAITAAQSFVGSIRVNAGSALRINNDNALGDVNNDITLAGGRLLRQAANATLGAGRTITLEGAGVESVFGGDGGTLTVNGLIQGDGTLGIHGASTVTIGGNNTYTGGTVLRRGTLLVNNFAEALGTGDITLKDGTLDIRLNGTGNAENIVFGPGAGYNFILPDDPDGIAQLDATVLVQNASGSNANNSIEINNLTIGDARLIANHADNYHLRVTGTTTLTGDAVIQPNNAFLTLAGQITDNGAGYGFQKKGADWLYVGSALNDYTGGTFINQGNVDMAERSLNVVTGNPNARLGVGPVVLNSNGAGNNSGAVILRLRGAGNIDAANGQVLVVTDSRLASNSRARLWVDADDITPDAIGLRSTGSGLWALTSAEQSLAMDLGAMGDGTWYLGAEGTSTYSAATLGVGRNDIWRLGGDAGTVNFTAENVFTGNGSIVVGESLTNLGTLPANTEGTIIIHEDQDFAGSVTVNKGSLSTLANTLEFRGSTAGVSEFNVAGRLVLGGDAALVDGSGDNRTLNLMAGGELRVDYANSSAADPRTLNKLSDTETIALNGASLGMVSHDAPTSAGTADFLERIGGLSVAGGSRIRFEDLPVEGNGDFGFIVGQIVTRVGQATLSFEENEGNFGSASGNNDLRFVIENGTAGTSATVADLVAAGIYFDPSGTFTNNAGMFAPWIVDATTDAFLKYNATANGGQALGITTAAFDLTFDAGGVLDPTNAGAAPNNGTQIAQILASIDHSGATPLDVLALKVGTTSAALDVTGSGDIIIRSGGLITAGTTGAISIAPDIFFGDGTTPVEAVLHIDDNSTSTVEAVTLSGQLTANALTKSGTGMLVLAGDNTGTLTGPIQVNSGELQLTQAGSSGGQDITLFGSVVDRAQLMLRNNAATNFGSNVSIAEGVTFAEVSVDRASGTGTNRVLTIGNLTLNTGNNPFGQSLRLLSANDYDLEVGTLSVNGDGVGTIRIHSDTGTDIRVMAGLAGDGNLTLAGQGRLLLLSDSPNFSGGLTINEGIVQVHGVEQGLGGHTGLVGDIVLNAGVLRLAANASTNFTDNSDLDLHINGSDSLWGNTGFALHQGNTIQISRVSSSGAVTLSLGGAESQMHLNSNGLLNIDVSSGATNGTFRWDGDVNLHGGSKTFRTVRGARFQIQGEVRESADRVGQKIVKTGDSRLTFNGANTFTGGLDIYEGVVYAAQAADRFVGGGDIRVFAGGRIMTNTAASLDGSNSSQIAMFRSTGTGMAGLGITHNATQAEIEALLPAANIIAHGNGGVLTLNGTRTINLDMATLYDGNWWLGSEFGFSGVYNGTTLGAGAGNTYRLTGGGGTLTLAHDGTLVGDNRVMFGKPNSSWTSIGGVVVDGNNSYTGGTQISRLQRVYVRTGNDRTALGSGDVHVFGDLEFDSVDGTAVAGLDGVNGGNANQYIFHPGSFVNFDYGSAFNVAGATGGRWADTVAMQLDGTTIDVRGNSTQNFTERVGEITFNRGSRAVIVDSGTTGSIITLSTPSLRRVGVGTLQIDDNTTIGDREVFLVDNGASLMTNGMVAPYISREGATGAASFLKYDAVRGLVPLETSDLTAFAPSLVTNGTQILDVGADSTADVNLDVHALQLNGSLNRGAGTQIVIRSGGILKRADTDEVIGLDVFAGDEQGSAELIINSSGNNNRVTFSGQIHASAVTQYGYREVGVSANQQYFDGDWNVNEGSLYLQQLGSLGQGHLFLNGTGSSDTGAQVIFNEETGTSDRMNFTGHGITVVNHARIQLDTGTNFRNIGIPDITLTSTTPDGYDHPGWLDILVHDDRNTLFVDNLTLESDYHVNVRNQEYAFGAGTGVQIGQLHNNGQHDLTVSLVTQVGTSTPLSLITTGGRGMMTLAGDSTSTFTGGTINVDFGTVRVLDNGALGDATSQTIVDHGGVLVLDTPGVFNPAATVVMREGSTERWANAGVRELDDFADSFTLGAGVNLELETSLLTAAGTINIDGGSIAGYLANDYLHETAAVLRQLGPGVTLNLLSDSHVGQINPFGSPLYDIGKQPNTSNLFNGSLQGAVLVIHGGITGGADMDLTKVGEDIVVIASASGVNDYGNTIIEGGILQIARDDALAVDGVLELRYSGIFDLNGYDQSMGNLAGTSGSIINSAATVATLAVGSNNADSTFAGAIGGYLNEDHGIAIGTIGPNIELAKTGTGNLTLTYANRYQGGTDVREGTLTLGIGQALGTGNVTVSGGTLDLAGFAQATDVFTLSSGLITNSGGANALLAVDDIQLHSGTVDAQLIGGITTSLTKSTAGTALLNVAPVYGGATLIDGGILRLGGNEMLPDTSNVTVNLGGTLDVNNFTETVAGLFGDGNVTLGTGQLIVAEANSSTFTGNITGAGDLVKEDSGTFVLEGDALINGSVEVAGGTLVVDGTLNSFGGVDLTVAGATLAGSGTILDTVTINEGTTHAVGSSVDSQTVNDEVWNFGGNYEFEIAMAGGTAGIDWDLLTVSNTLTINATSVPTEEFNIIVRPLANAGDNTAGLIPDFNPLDSYQWLMIDTNGLVLNGTGTLAERFIFDLSEFSPLYGGVSAANFFVSAGGAGGSDLYLNYSSTAIPEPGSMLLVALAALGMAGYGWRRRRQKAELIEETQPTTAA